MARYDYRIGAGNDLALGSLTNIEDITPSGDVAFYAPEVLASYDPGIRRIRGNGSLYHAGYPNQTWTWKRMTRKQYAYLRATYCSGGYDGPVTIYTRFGDDADTYVRCNARMIVPKENEMQTYFTNYGATIQMVKIEEL